MKTLKKTTYVGEIVWLGATSDSGDTLRAAQAQTLDATIGGIPGTRHGGAMRPSCSRVLNLYPRDTQIRNVRQLTILSAEEMDEIAAELALGRLDPGLLGATIVVRGIPDLTHVPPSSRLQSAQGTTLTVDLENLPCHLPAREIEAQSPGHGKAFKSAATGRRGVTAWVERAGRLHLGDALTLFVPTQRGWQA